MHKIEKLGLQVFAAPDGMTGKAQIQVKVREIDFVTSFAKNIQSLLDIMGITKMIKRGNGTTLKKKTASGTLKSGSVAEGEEIPLSQYEVTEEIYDTITIEKYRKAVSLESIAEHGYENAVAMTDEEFKTQLRDVVLERFYTFIKSGTLISTESTWQMAIAMGIGRVKDKFKKMHRTATGVAVWVNTLDLYKYIGMKDITIQTAFGMDYVKDFLGAGLVFISSEIEEGTVIATPVNNMIAYYVDPGDSEFAQAGLPYTTDADTGFIGFHTEGTYNRALSEAFAIMGVRLFAEYQDAIAVITVDETPTLGTLAVASEAGSKAGNTRLTVSPGKESASNVYKYKISDADENVSYGQNVKAWSAWSGEADITAATGKKITVVEADATYKALNAGSGAVVAKE